MHELTHKEHHGPREGSPLVHLLVGLIVGAAVAVGITLAVNKPDAPTTSQASHDSMSQMVEGLRVKTGDDFDRAFIEAMIPHHESAVQMAKLIDAQAKHPEVKALGADIIAAQNDEINRMKRWYTDWGYGTYGDTPGPNHTMH